MATSKKYRPYNFGNSGITAREADRHSTALKIATRRPARCLAKHRDRSGLFK